MLETTKSRTRDLQNGISSAQLEVLHVNTLESGGGAARLAADLVTATNEAGHNACLLVGRRSGNLPGTLQLDQSRYRNLWARLCDRLAARLGLRNRLSRLFGRPLSTCRILLGHEDFDFPATWRLLEIAGRKPDLVHLHNLHGGYFDLRVLPSLSARIPTFLTLHDAWMLSGHCSHSFSCERWRGGWGRVRT